MDHQIEKTPSRYELKIDGDVAGFLDYADRDGVRAMPHTVVQPAYRGQGLSSPLIKHALDDARLDHVKVNLTCWAVAGYIDKHPEYKDLLA